MSVEAPLIARARKAGQFEILRVDAEWGDRIPLTIADADAEKGTIDIVYQTVGETTKRLAALGVGDEIANIVGPLGRPTEIAKVGRVVVARAARLRQESSASCRPRADSPSPLRQWRFTLPVMSEGTCLRPLL